MSARGRRILRVASGRAWRGLWQGRFGFAGAQKRRTEMARQIRLACEDLGPAFIKLGQLASVRPDVFSAELVFELERLQDCVPAVPVEEIRETIRREFGREPERLFRSFAPEPLAAASIAQVHRAVLAEDYTPVVGATLRAGAALAVKVVRPGVQATIKEDLVLARRWAARLDRTWFARRVDISAFLGEFEESLRSELDLRNEGRVAERFAHDFRDDKLVFVPRVVWPLSSRSVLTMEFVEGWRLTELDDAARRGIDGRALAVHGANVFMRQVLVLGRYHADLHPANLFVTPDGRIAYLDFGIIGRTCPAKRNAIAQVLAATVYGDADRAITYSAELGLVVPQERRAAVTSEVAELMDVSMGRDGRRADMRAFVLGFLRIMARHRIAIPTGFGMLIKALVTVEGVARAIYPEIDIVDSAKPFATRLIAARMMEPGRLSERIPSALRAALRELSS